MNTIRKTAIIACIAMLGVCCAGDYSNRKYNNEGDYTNPLSHRIVDVDCVYEDGKFIMKTLPTNLPSLFTIRFTAPEDFTQGNVVVIHGKELPVRTPGMVSASSGLFAAGAVMHCDVDLDREIAFFWQNGNGAVGGVLPNLSYDEQFAGFYDVDGKPVYTKLIKGPILSTTLTRTYSDFNHNIENIKKVVRLEMTGYLRGLYAFANNHTLVWFSPNGELLSYCSADVRGDQIRIESRGPYADTPVYVQLYYTCTDR